MAKASMCETNKVEAAQNASENNHQHQQSCLSVCCIQDYFQRNCQHVEKIFLVLEFLLGKYKVELSQKYLFLFRVDHCPQFLFAQVAAKITFFVSHPLLVSSLTSSSFLHL